MSTLNIDSKFLAMGHVFGVTIEADSRRRWGELMAEARSRLMGGPPFQDGVRNYDGGEFTFRESMDHPITALLRPIADEICKILNRPGSFASQTSLRRFSIGDWNLICSEVGKVGHFGLPHSDYSLRRPPFGVFVSGEANVGTMVYMPRNVKPEVGHLLPALVAKQEGTPNDLVDEIYALLNGGILEEVILPPETLWVLSSSTLHSRGFEPPNVGEGIPRNVFHVRLV